MNGLKKIKMIRDYCDYCEEHLFNVEKAWEIIKEKLKHNHIIYDDHLCFSIDNLIKNHDLSKFSENEFIQYAEWFYNKSGSQWDSFDTDNEDEHKELQKKFNIAWDNHKLKNEHHWENWTQKGDGIPNAKACHCLCMVIDWMAMGMKFGDTAEEYYNNNKDKIKIPGWAVRFLEQIFRDLKK